MRERERLIRSLGQQNPSGPVPAVMQCDGRVLADGLQVHQGADRQPPTLPFTPAGNLESPLHLICMCLWERSAVHNINSLRCHANLLTFLSEGEDANKRAAAVPTPAIHRDIFSTVTQRRQIREDVIPDFFHKPVKPKHFKHPCFISWRARWNVS